MRPHRFVVATAAAWSALLLGALVAALSLPIDDFWLSLASAREIGAGADPARAIDLTWTPMLPDALNPQWGAQVVLGLPGSEGGALMINAALIAGGLGLTAARIRRRVGSAATAIAMLAAIAVLAPHLLARAQSFSVVLLPAALLLLDRRPARPWQPLAYGVLVAVWANLHGAFVVGQVAAGAALVTEVFAQRRHDPEARPLTSALTLVVALAAPLLNPAGPALIGYAYAQPGLDLVRSISVEWQPSWPWIPVAALFWIFAALVAAAALVRRRTIAPGELLLVVALGILAVTGIRLIPWFVLASAPLLGEGVEVALRAARGPGRVIGEVRGPLGGPRAAAWMAGVGLLVVLVQPIRPALPNGVGRVTPDAPVEMAELLEERLAAGGAERVLNEQVWGGYLAYRLGDRLQTAMDGRLEIRDRTTWVAYFSMVNGRDDPASVLAAADVRWAAISHRRDALTTALLAAGWRIELDAPDGLLLHRP
jgi:hypothetical protein